MDGRLWVMRGDGPYDSPSGRVPERRPLGRDAPLPQEMTAAPVVASTGWPAGRPRNYQMPEHVPVRPQGDKPVIVHLVWDTHEELVPGRAIRWTPTHVMVMIKPLTGPKNAHELIVWLRAQDVFATIPRRPRGRALPGGL